MEDIEAPPHPVFLQKSMEVIEKKTSREKPLKKEKPQSSCRTSKRSLLPDYVQEKSCTEKLIIFAKNVRSD